MENKKIFIIALVILLPIITFSQYTQDNFNTWHYEKVGNPFDGFSKRAFVYGKGNNPDFQTPVMNIIRGDNSEYLSLIISNAGDLFFVGEVNLSFDETDIVYSAQYYTEKSYEIDLRTFNKENDGAGVSIYTIIEELKSASKVYVRLIRHGAKRNKVYNDMTFSLQGSTKQINKVIPPELIEKKIRETKEMWE